MTSSQAAIQIKNGVNKLDSKDYPNIPLFQIEEATNIAAKRFVRERIDAKESSLKLIEDLQVLLKPPTRLAGSDKGVYFLSHKIPSDFMAFSKVTPICDKGNCKGVRIPSEPVEDSNTDVLLQDYSSQPSFDFEQTFHSVAGNKIKQYHNKDFEVKEIELIYYKNPQHITYPGTPQFDGGIGKDMVWEFKEDVCDVIIERAIKIIAGDIENNNRFQVAQQNIQEIK